MITVLYFCIVYLIKPLIFVNNLQQLSEQCFKFFFRAHETLLGDFLDPYNFYTPIGTNNFAISFYCNVMFFTRMVSVVDSSITILKIQLQDFKWFNLSLFYQHEYKKNERCILN